MSSLAGAVQYRISQYGDMEKYAGMRTLAAYEDDAMAAMRALGRHLDRVRTAKELRAWQGDTWPDCLDEED